MMIKADRFYFAVVNDADRLLPWTIASRLSEAKTKATDYLPTSMPKTWDSCKRNEMRPVKVRIEGFNE